MCGGGDNKVKDSPKQRHLAKVAAEKWNFSQENLAPLEDAYMAHVDGMDSESNMSYIRGRTMQGMNQSGSEAMEQLDTQMAASGINPNSGRYMGTMDDMGLELGEAGGETAGRAEFEQESQKVMGMQNVTAIGQGQSGKAQAGLSSIAQRSVGESIDNAQNAFNRRSANLQLVGNVAGAATSYGMNSGGGGAPGTSASDYSSPEFSSWADNQ